MARLPYQALVYIRRRSTDGAWEYLLLRRVATHGGFWQGVTGVVEETGYRQFVRFAPLDFRYSFSLDRPQWGHLYAPEVEVIHEECFRAEVARDQGEPALDPREHDEYRWLDVERALALLIWPENQEALRRFADLP
jgi:NUDIX domain-containing protein